MTRKELVVYVERTSDELTTYLKQFTSQLLSKLKSSSYQLTDDISYFLSLTRKAIRQILSDGIRRVVDPDQLIGIKLNTTAGLQDQFILQEMEQAFNQRVIKGLTLSQRLWNWSQQLSTTVTTTLAQGIRLGQEVQMIAAQIQQQIDAYSGIARKIEIVVNPDWMDSLANSGKALIKNPAIRQQWKRSVKEARQRIQRLSDNPLSTKRAAQDALNQIIRGMNQGNSALIDAAIEDWVYEKQQFILRRIAHTEMAVAHRSAQLSINRYDSDVIGYRWLRNALHVHEDECDELANVEAGLGRGILPKRSVPILTHPFCKCMLVPVIRPEKQKGSVPLNTIRSKYPNMIWSR